MPECSMWSHRCLATTEPVRLPLPKLDNCPRPQLGFFFLHLHKFLDYSISQSLKKHFSPTRKFPNFHRRPCSQLCNIYTRRSFTRFRSRWDSKQLVGQCSLLTHSKFWPSEILLHKSAWMDGWHRNSFWPLRTFTSAVRHPDGRFPSA